MKKKKRGESIPALKRKAWEIFSRVFRQIYADHRGFVTCVTCGKVAHWKDGMQAGHFVPKASGTALYFDCRNVHVQCSACNCAGSYSTPEAERVKIKYTIWMTNIYGNDEVSRLIGIKSKQMKMYRSDYHELIEHLKECEKELGE